LKIANTQNLTEAELTKQKLTEKFFIEIQSFESLRSFKSIFFSQNLTFKQK
jgi:hypothetical protein